MIILFKIEGKTTEVTCNGFKTKHKTHFLKKQSFNDLILYLESISKEKK